MKDKKQLFLYAASALTAILSLLPFFKIGFTTGDDFIYYHTAHSGLRYWLEDAQAYAEDSGRFYFYVTKYLYSVPYLLDNFAYIKAVQYISLIACYGLFSYFVYRLFKSRNLGLMTFLLLIVDLAVTQNNHIVTIAYPFFFSFSIIIFLTALLLYLSYTERGGWWRVAVSALLFLFIYMCYETYLVFALIFGAIVVVRHWRKSGFLPMLRSKTFWSETLPYVIVTVVYLVCYWAYHHWVTTTMPDKVLYEGSSFSPETFSATGFFSVLWRCTREALPWMPFHENQWLFADNTPLVSGHRASLLWVLGHAPAIVWVNALLQGILLWIVTNDTFKSLNGRKTLVGILLSVVVAFSAHILIGITPKYNLEWSSWMHGYVTTIYSILAIMLAFALIIAFTVRLCRRQWIQRTVRTVWCLLMVIMSVAMGYSNDILSREWERSQNRMTLIDHMGHSGFFGTLPDDAVIYTEELHNTSTFAHDISKWSMEIEDYINRRAGRQFKYITDLNDLAQLPADRPLYYLHAIETKKACELLISIARLDTVRSNQPDDLRATEAEIFFYSPCKRYTLFYQSASQWKPIPYSAEDINAPATRFHLQDTAINPRTIVVSNMTLPQ